MVLNAFLKKNTALGILECIAHNEVPPRVEYNVTNFGAKLIKILDALEQLQSEISADTNAKTMQL